LVVSALNSICYGIKPNPQDIMETLDNVHAIRLHISDVYSAKSRRLLIKLLSQIRASDATWLASEDIATLCKMLPPRMTISNWSAISISVVEADFRIAILRAFEQVGTNRVLPTVERIANSAPRNAQYRRVVEAARECLPAIRQRAYADREQRTLLRPAHAPASDTLLRPARNTGEEDAALLLRPSEGGGDNP